MACYILFNPLADKNHGEENAKKIEAAIPADKYEYINVTKTDEICDFINAIPAEDTVVLSGGDGTINRFVNSLGGKELERDLLYFPAGSGNDFFADVKDKAENGFIKLNDYIKDLPVVTIDGKSYKFLNGVGYGIDGYCCEVADKQRAKDANKKINYTAIAIKGLLFSFKPANATVTVDGVVHHFKKAWIAPTMNGSYYGGGMHVAPNQNRLNRNGKLSVVLMHGSGKLKTLMVFPKIFKGEHIKYTDMVTVLTGSEITVEFDKPIAAQIDGETVLNVTKCHSVLKVKETADIV